jgi:hypothetical protein
MNMTPRALSRQCSRYTPSADKKHFKRALELVGS